MEITNGNLFNFHTQLNELNGSILYILLQGRIKDFYKNNEIRIKSLLTKINTIQLKYYVSDNNILQTHLIDNKKQYILKPDSNKEEYDKEINELFSKKVNIII